MKQRTGLAVVWVAAVVATISTNSQARAEWAGEGRGTKGIVSSTHPLGTAAGIAAMKAGGNAIDAAVAVGLTLGVVDGHNSGIGGGCFMLIRRANGEIVVLDGRETAPAAASRDMYLRNGKADTDLSQNGALASGVPGALAVYAEALTKFGKRSLADAILPAADIAEQGFPINRVYAKKLAASADQLRKHQGEGSIFFKADGTALVEGEVLQQRDLAASYRAIAREGAAWFYEGQYARAVGSWMGEHGGLITAKDMAGYRVRYRKPFMSTYRGYTIVNIPPPSSGGVHVAQMLNILENFDVAGLNDVGEREHLIAETMKLAFADRAFWLGDPEYVNVPLGLVDKGYAKELAKKISLEKATVVASHGVPPDAETRLFEKHTTHFSTADAEGNWVSCTATINTAFGSKVIVPGTGILLNNEMDDFSVEPGVPNHFRLVGAEANAIAPGKRPLSCMSPTIVLKDGEPVLAIGAAGGPTIISQVLLGLVNILDLKMPLEEAISRPRVHQQWVPDQIRIEQALAPEVRAALEARGHKLFQEVSKKGVKEETYGVTHVVGRDASGKGFVGAADPRAGGNSDGW